jgi:ABC-type Fe3+-siderophore transport system permease subunit
MFSKFVRWGVWSLGGLVLIGLMMLHFSHMWLMPDYLIMTIGICFGMYSLMFVDTIIGEMLKSKRPKGGKE